MKPQPRVVILGAGFAGLWAAKTLAKARIPSLIIDQNNFHTFLPLLYQVATAGIEPEDITYPIRGILRGLPGCQFMLSQVKEVEPTGRIIQTGLGTVSYDYLVVATGSRTRYFNVPGAESHSFSLKTLDEAIYLRNHILCCFEQASRENDPAIRKALLTFVVVGGGATGIEFAGAFAELAKGPIIKDYPELKRSEIELTLVESDVRLLKALPASLGDYAGKRLQKMGVHLRLNQRVTGVAEGRLSLGEGGVLGTRTVVWLAGISGNSPAMGLPGSAPDARIPVGPTLQAADQENIFCAGDLANLQPGGAPLAQVAPVAIQQGITAAENIIRIIHGQPCKNFAYRDKGSMVTIGRNAAVASMGKLRFTGFLAWFVWLGLHLFKLIGFRNRVLVLVNWAWDYFLVDRAVRIILPSCSCGVRAPGKRD